MHTTRRDFLKRAAELSGGTALSAMWASSLAQALAIDPPEDSTYLDAEHVVILMQENRSFDHALGMLRGVRGFNDPRAVTLPDQKPVWLQTNAAGETYAPFRLDLKNTKATWLGSLPHSWRDQIDARNRGNHDKWLDSKRSSRKECAGMPFTMGYYDRNDLPFYYALADAFTVCDQHFCSSLTGTTPNRLYLWTGTVREKQQADSMPCVRNSEVTYGSPARWTTFPERLEDAGVSWKVYQNELSIATGLNHEEDAWLANFTDNPLEWFEQYHAAFLPAHRRHLAELVDTLPGEIAQLRQKLAAASTPEMAKALDKKESLLREAKADLVKFTPQAWESLPLKEKSLHQKALATNVEDSSYRQLAPLAYRDQGVERQMKIPKGDVLFEFRKDVESGKLPAVSWLVAPENFSDHPGAPWYGAWYVAEVLDILTRNPEIWKKTIFVLTYDENDGYFDHVPPFVPPDPRNPESGKVSAGIDVEPDYLHLDQDLKRRPAREARGGPIGLGYRVPMLVASPWSRGGYVCSQVFDHTSVLQLLETIFSRRTGKVIRESNISSWRRTVCGDLSSVFRQDQPAAAIAKPLQFPAKNDFLEDIHRAQFKEFPSAYRQKTVPEQEPGIRPATALPYELYAEGSVSADGKQFDLLLEAGSKTFGKASAGSAFHVYTPGTFRNRADLRARAYAVAAGNRVTDSWQLEGFASNRYHLRVHGPNGFFREMTGGPSDPLVEIRCEYTPSGQVVARLASRAPGSLTVRIVDHGYKTGNQSVTLPPHRSRSIALMLSHSFGWYDFSVRVDSAEAFTRRYAGRVETGKAGFSDPLMGRVKV